MTGEWRNHEWGDIATLEYGKSLRDYHTESGRYRVYGTNGPIGWHDEPLCTHPGVIVGRKGAYRGIHYSPAPFFVIDTAFYLNPKEKIDLHWAYYCLLTYDINGMDSGSAIPSTCRESFYRLPVRVPPLKEQQSIACILGALDDKIELNRRMNKTLEAMARAIFKSWFVDFDPVRAKAAVRQKHPKWTDEQISRAACPNLIPTLAALFPDTLEDSVLGEIPKGWEIKGLDGIARFLNGLALQKYPPKDGRSIPVIKIAQLRVGHTEGADAASADLDCEYIVEDGDVLFSWSGSLDCTIWTGGAGVLNQHLFKVTSAIYPKWFYYLWIHEHLENFRHIAAGKATTIGHIQRHHLSDAKVVVPDCGVFEAANNLMASIVDHIIQRRLESCNLASLRDALLPKLISGEFRIPNAERIVGRCL